MARNAVTVALFCGFALICCLQTTSASFDLGEYISERLHKTIKEEKITCDNYEKFCLKSNEQFQTNKNDVKEVETNEMAIELCKVILKAHVCKDENDVQKHD